MAFLKLQLEVAEGLVCVLPCTGIQMWGERLILCNLALKKFPCSCHYCEGMGGSETLGRARCVLKIREEVRSGFEVRFHPAKSNVFETSTCAGDSGMSPAPPCPDLWFQVQKTPLEVGEAESL